MASRRRTMPRSLARHSQQTPGGAPPRSSPVLKSRAPSPVANASTSFYAPTFSTAPSPSPSKHLGAQPVSSAAVPLTTPPSTLYSPETHFSSAPLSTIRWLPSSQTALAAVGSADGTPASDFVARRKLASSHCWLDCGLLRFKP